MSFWWTLLAFSRDVHMFLLFYYVLFSFLLWTGTTWSGQGRRPLERPVCALLFHYFVCFVFVSTCVFCIFQNAIMLHGPCCLSTSLTLTLKWGLKRLIT